MKTLIFIIYFLNPATGDVSTTTAQVNNLDQAQCTAFVDSVDGTQVPVQFVEDSDKVASFQAYCV